MSEARRADAALGELEATIAARLAEGDPDRSYTARLVARGPQQCAKKLGEEGVEAALACAAGTREEFVGEAADLLYHLLVALASRGIPLSEVAARLAERRGVGGLEEKAGRSGK